MKSYLKEFCKRGLMWGAWGGPAVLAIVWLCLGNFGIVSSITVEEAALGILSTTILGFITAGVSVVNTIETLPKVFAALIQCAVLYADYLGVYLINGWLPVEKIVAFTLIFVAVFAVIWLSVYISVRLKVNRLNGMLKK